MVIPLTYGRMGNFLFQAATAMAYAWDHGLEYTMPSKTDDPKWNPIYLQYLVNPKYNPKLPKIELKEHGHSFQHLPFKERWRQGNIVLDGYWQNARYFQHHREGIINHFGFEWYSLPGVVSVHVRRGDYLTIKRGKMFKHPPVTFEWYMDQMAKFPEAASFKFFSDDIEWCEAKFGYRGDCQFSRGQTEERDLVDMSCCAHHICSASTFSWWGAWLNQNPNKRVIFPKHWLTPGWHADQPDPVQGMGWERA